MLSTNCDLILDKYFDDLVFCDIRKEWPIQGPALVKIHGSLCDKNSLVFTTAEYLKRYSDDRFKDYLRSIFSSDKTILFIGYGMSEFELLEYMLSPVDQMNSSNKIFVLKGYFSYEEIIKKHMDLYYSSINIRQIAFSKDKNNHEQLSSILSNWKKKIEENTALRENRIKQFRILLQDIDSINDNIPKINQIISEDSATESIFYKELSRSASANLYIEALKDTLFIPDKFFSKQEFEAVDYKVYCLIYLLPNADSELTTTITDIIDKYLEYIINNQTCLKFYNAIYGIIQIICMFKKYPSGERLYSFIKSLKSDDVPYGYSERLIIEIIRNKDAFKFWGKRVQKLIYEIALNQFLKNNNFIYWFKKFNDKFGEYFYHKIGGFVFDSLKDAIKNLSEKNKYNFWHVGSVAKPKRNIHQGDLRMI